MTLRCTDPATAFAETVEVAAEHGVSVLALQPPSSTLLREILILLSTGALAWPPWQPGARHSTEHRGLVGAEVVDSPSRGAKCAYLFRWRHEVRNSYSSGSMHFFAHDRLCNPLSPLAYERQASVVVGQGSARAPRTGPARRVSPHTRAGSRASRWTKGE
jgi:hypothetical protein